MKCRSLTSKQARFAEEYSLDHNGAAAAVRAGYAPNSAKVTSSRLLTKANVKSAVAALEAEAARALNITREGVLTALGKAYEDARRQDNPAVMVSAVKQIILVCGFARPERKAAVASTGAEATMARMNAMSDAELLAILEESATD